MSAQEFGLWQAFHARLPIGQWGAYWRSGLVCATVANYAGKMRGKNAAPATPEDFMPRDGAEDTQETPAQWLRNLGN